MSEDLGYVEYLPFCDALRNELQHASDVMVKHYGFFPSGAPPAPAIVESDPEYPYYLHLLLGTVEGGKVLRSHAVMVALAPFVATDPEAPARIAKRLVDNYRARGQTGI